MNSDMISSYLHAMNALSKYLREQHADQGGEASFSDWLVATASDPAERFHEEAVVLLRYNAGEYAQQPINQCDGCRRGLPVNDHGIHRAAGYDLMACTAHLYQPTAPQPMTEDQIIREIPGIGWDDPLDTVLPIVRAVERHHGIGKGERWP